MAGRRILVVAHGGTLWSVAVRLPRAVAAEADLRNGDAVDVPDAGHLVWLAFDPQAGRAGER